MHGRKIMGWIATLMLSVLLLSVVPAKTDNNQSQIIDRGDKVQLNLNNVDIDVIIQYLAKFSGEHYLKDPTANAKISIMANKPVTRKEAVIILEEALIFNNFTIMKHGLAKYVVPTRFAKQYGIDVKIGKAGVDKIDTANLQMRFFKIEYKGVRNMQTILQTILGKNGQIVPHPQEMMLQVIDTTFGLQRMSELIDKLDVPDELLEMYVVHLENTTAAKMIGQLKAIFAKNLVLRGSPNVVEAEEDNINFIADDRTNKVIVICHAKYIAQIRETARILDQELGNINQVQLYKVQYAEPDALAKQLTELFPKDALKILPDERLNSILIISPSDRMIRAVQDMATKLDMKGAASDGDVRVYYLEHSDAKDMSDILTKLFDKKKTDQKKPVSIVPDESTNALVITGSKAQFDEVVAILKKLDIFRAQVLVEAVIVEVQMSYVKSLGINLSAFGGSVGDNNSFGAITNMGVTPGLGLNFGVVENDAQLADLAANKKIKALLRAFKNSNQANVLSAPQILTMDNEEAKIVVGEVVPLPTGVNTALNTGNQTISNFRFEDVGLDLNIKPRITQKETISLDVKLEIKARSSDALFEFQVPIITRRSIDTTVNTRDGDTVVIGGLMRDQKDNAEEKIPLLSRLPVLGKLFRNKERRNQKTNLFVFLTPYVLSDEQELKHLTKRMNDTMNSSMNKTEFNPLSFEEGKGILAAIEDTPKEVKPIKVDRIRPDGHLEPLKIESVDVPDTKSDAESVPSQKQTSADISNQSVEKVTVLSTDSVLQTLVVSEQNQTIENDEHEYLARSIDIQEIQLDEVSKETVVQGSIASPQTPIARSNVLKLPGEAISIEPLPVDKNAIHSSKRKSRPSLLQSIRDKIRNLTRDIDRKKSGRSDQKDVLDGNEIEDSKLSVKSTEVLTIESEGPLEETAEMIAHQEPEMSELISEPASDEPQEGRNPVELIEVKSADRSVVQTADGIADLSASEATMIVQEKLDSAALASDANAKSELPVEDQFAVANSVTEIDSQKVFVESADSALNVTKHTNSNSEILSEVKAQNAESNSENNAENRTEDLTELKLERKALGRGIKNVKQALVDIKERVSEKNDDRVDMQPTGDQKFDSLMDKVRSQREKAHLKATQNQKLLFPSRPRLNNQKTQLRPAQQETFDQLVGNLELTISRQMSAYSEHSIQSEKLAREKDDEFNQLVEKLERNLARN